MTNSYNLDDYIKELTKVRLLDFLPLALLLILLLCYYNKMN